MRGLARLRKDRHHSCEGGEEADDEVRQRVHLHRCDGGTGSVRCASRAGARSRRRSRGAAWSNNSRLTGRVSDGA